jgi:hypothetical protein
MGLIEFFIVVIVCCVLAWAACWFIGWMAPGHPPFVDFLIWGVACLIILVTLMKALGLYGIDPQIPRLR